MSLVFVIYGAISLIRLIVQIMLAHVHYLRHLAQSKCPQTQEPSWPSISVIYPVFNESPEILQRVMERVTQCLSIPQIQFIFVDDGSPNRSMLAPIYSQFKNERVTVVYQDNAGKRYAQCNALDLAVGDFIVTVDSDTLISLDGLRHLVAPLQRHPTLGAVCGDVCVENTGASFLALMQSARYWTAFHIERAAQSVFCSVLCCSGPFSAYRRDVFMHIKEKYKHQSFCGRECTYGDDRHLTNLILAEGMGVVFQPDAIASTYVPSTLREYLNQQNRWNKSFYREILWTLRIAHLIHPYALVDMLLQPVLFLVFTLALSNYLLLQIATFDFRISAVFIAMVLIGGASRAVYGLYRTRSTHFLYFVLYGFLHVFVLTPVKFKSLMTLSDTRWGTRGRTSSSFTGDLLKWFSTYFAVVTIGAASLFFVNATLADTTSQPWLLELVSMESDKIVKRVAKMIFDVAVMSGVVAIVVGCAISRSTRVNVPKDVNG